MTASGFTGSGVGVDSTTVTSGAGNSVAGAASNVSEMLSAVISLPVSLPVQAVVNSNTSNKSIQRFRIFEEK